MTVALLSACGTEGGVAPGSAGGAGEAGLGGVGVGVGGAGAGGGLNAGGAAGATSGAGSGGVPSGGASGSSTAGAGAAGGGEPTNGGNPGGGTSGGSESGGTGGAGGTGALPNVTVWLAGDSTVANGNTPCPRGWGAELQPLLSDAARVVNSAVGGRSVRTWTYRVQAAMDSSGECVLERDANGEPLVQDRWQTMLDGMMPGDYLLIQFGINDSSATCDRHVGLAAFQETYGVLAAAAKARGAQPVFVTPVSAVACDGGHARGTRGGYVNATLQAGETFDVPVIDLHARSVALYESLGFCPIPGGDVGAGTTGAVGEFFCDDHTHFDAPGARAVAELVAKALRAQGIGLGLYVE